ncbi:hypothetical protein LWI29_014198 [Acer saccharum]|uniref:Uncharacterized protein n=1 Tax=Acer saccharum TaxID=4024 RepID=A0AA39RU12_ACESA|nr:hypothetical protein LWI29_014198 [Acer saccharum]
MFSFKADIVHEKNHQSDYDDQIGYKDYKIDEFGQKEDSFDSALASSTSKCRFSSERHKQIHRRTKNFDLYWWLHAQAHTLAALAGAAVVEYYDHKSGTKGDRYAKYLPADSYSHKE